ncbi:MAG: DUF378 domain-containing protein [Chlamydiales bacterium]|nr:DUF378 domain-containing protein [Chlamydiales bacterium]
MKAVKCIVKLLIVVGALNWGLVGFFQYDLVAEIFGGVSSTGARVVYSLVGLAGLFALGCVCCKGRVCGCGCKNCGPDCDCCGKKRQR